MVLKFSSTCLLAILLIVHDSKVAECKPALNQLQAAPYDPCKGNDQQYFADPESCLYFYECSNRIPYRMPCAPGTAWNDAKVVCDWPSYSKCMSTAGPVPPSTAPPTKAPTAAETTTRRTTAASYTTIHPTNAPTTARPTTIRPTNTPSTERPTRQPTNAPFTNEPSTERPTTRHPTNAPSTGRPIYSTVATDRTRLPLSTTASYPNPCKGNYQQYYPDPLNCRFYYECSSHVAYHMPCAPGTAWDDSIDVCNWPAYVNCMSTDRPDDTTTTAKPSTARATTAGPYNPCNGEDYYPDPKDCSKFYQCAGNIAYHMSCPKGTEWNSQIDVCDWPENAHCNSQRTTTTKATVSTTPKSDICQGASYYPDPTDCSHFYQCVGSTAYLMECPKGTEWNAQANGCDWPENAGCSVNPDTDATTQNVDTTKHNEVTTQEIEVPSTENHKGTTQKEGGTTERDSGTTEGDSGTTEGDSGTTEGDIGTTEGDSGTTEGDSGPTEGDSGTTDFDGETTEFDGETTECDDDETTEYDESTTEYEEGTTEHDDGTTEHDRETTEHDERTTRHRDRTTGSDQGTTGFEVHTTEHASDTTTAASVDTTTEKHSCDGGNTPPPADPCQGQEYAPDALDCSKYYYCPSAGIAYRLSCPLNSLWDSEEDKCSFSRNVTCPTAGNATVTTAGSVDPSDSSTPNDQGDNTPNPEELSTTDGGSGDYTEGPSSPPNPETTTLDIVTDDGSGDISTEGHHSLPTTKITTPDDVTDDSGYTTTHSSRGSTTTTAKSNPSSEDPCNGESFSPDPTDCTKYYFCLDGVAYHVSCPTGLEWNSDTSACEHPEDAQCTVGPVSESTTSKTDTLPANPTTGYPISDGTSSEAPPQTTENPICDHNSFEDTPVENPCHGDTYYPDYYDCTKFYFCDGVLAFHRHCPTGTSWDSITNSCVEPELAVCVGYQLQKK